MVVDLTMDKYSTVDSILEMLEEEAYNSYVNIKTSAGTIQVSAWSNPWSDEPFYAVDYVELDEEEFVESSTHVGNADNLLQVAQYLSLRR